MPLYLNDLDVTAEVEDAKSVLIVPCRTCPATSLAVRNNKPVFEFFKTFLRSPPLDHHIKILQSRLEAMGLKTGVYLSRQFLACAWTSGERKRLLKRAKQFDTVIVLGCDSATESVRDALKSIDCKVIQGMEIAGIVNVKVKFHFPGTLTLEDSRIIKGGRKINERE
jgi:hypothetical protein